MSRVRGQANKIMTNPRRVDVDVDHLHRGLYVVLQQMARFLHDSKKNLAAQRHQITERVACHKKTCVFRYYDYHYKY